MTGRRSAEDVEVAHTYNMKICFAKSRRNLDDTQGSSAAADCATDKSVLLFSTDRPTRTQNIIVVGVVCCLLLLFFLVIVFFFAQTAEISTHRAVAVFHCSPVRLITYQDHLGPE